MPLKDLPARTTPDLTTNSRNWEWLRNLRGEQVDLGTPVNDTDPANKAYVDSQIGGGTSPTGPAGGDLSGSYPNPTVGTGKITSSKILDGTIQPADLAFDPATQTELDAEATTRGSADTTLQANIDAEAVARAAAVLAAISTAEAYSVQRANHTGTQAASTISDLAAVVKAYRLDEFAAPNSNLSIGSHKLTNVSDATQPTDAPNYAQLLTAAQAATAGLAIKSTVRVATTANITSTSSTALVLQGSGTLTVDGKLLATGDRVLLKNQTTASENGIWEYSTGATNFGGTGSFGGTGIFADPSSGWSLTRTTDADQAAEFPGMFVPVGGEGTANPNTLWLLTTTGAITVGSTNLTYAPFTAPPSGSAGGELTGTYPNPTVANSTITNAKVAAAAAIAYSKLATLNTGQALIGNAGTPTATTLTGDVTVGATGVTAIGSGKVTSTMILDNTIVDGDLTANTLSAALPNLGTYFAVPHLGNNSGLVVTANVGYFAQVVVPWKATLTGVHYFCSVTASGNVRSALYDASGARVANRTTNLACAVGFQKVPFDSTYVAVPGVYYVLTLFSAATTAAATIVTVPNNSAAGPGSTATNTSITPPTVALGSAIPTMTTY